MAKRFHRRKRAIAVATNTMTIFTEFAEGRYTSRQLENLHHLAKYAPAWYWFERSQKRPMNPAGGPGKVSEPATAGTLSEALATMQRKNGGGVGVLVSSGRAGLIGIDIDNCIHGGEVHPFGLEVLEQFRGAYAEVSPSGTGLRIFCEGQAVTGTPAGSTALGLACGGKQIKAEIYAAGGPGRFLRTTGAALDCTAGAVGPCQSGITWLSAQMIAARSIAGAGSVASPDNDNSKGSSADSSRDSVAGMNLDAMFDALAELRDEVEDVDAIVEAIKASAAAKSRSKLAEAWAGKLTGFNGDHSMADAFMCCEAIRRGAGNLADVVKVWGASGVSKRTKFKRKDYQAGTVKQAARAVLADLRKQGATSGNSGAVSVTLSEELTKALEASGDKLTRSARGRLEATAGNVIVIFRNDPRCAGVLAFNELAQRAERLKPWTVFDRLGADKDGPLTDDDVTRVSLWLAAEYSMKLEHGELLRGLNAAGYDRRFDPLAEALEGLARRWDGVSRLNTWLKQYGQIEDSGCEEYVSAVGRVFLVGAVARAFSPGCQLDTVFAIEGAGGAGKSTLFQVLADAVGSGLFADGVHDVSSPVALVEGTQGRWIVELAELAGIRRAQDVEALKAAITRREDTHRRPYDVLPRTLPRRFIFCATTNRDQYLNDASGALMRRFHPVRTLATEASPIDRKGLAEIAPQLWGEAVRAYRAGAKWHLSESDGEAYRQWGALRDLRRESGAFEDELTAYLRDWVGDDQLSGRSLKDIAKAVGDFKAMDGDQASRNRLGETLRTLGMESRKMGGGLKKWFFTPSGQRKFLTLREQSRQETLPA